MAKGGEVRMIQIDMPMPKCCDECFALDDHGDYPFCLISKDQRGYTFNVREKRMPTCPLKAQEPRVMGLNELDFYDSGLYVETHNGCPEGLTDELWPALVNLYCVSQNGECGYVSFINWNADTYDFEAKDYNVLFRCWTSRPDKATREATPWS